MYTYNIMKLIPDLLLTCQDFLTKSELISRAGAHPRRAWRRHSGTFSAAAPANPAAVLWRPVAVLRLRRSGRAQARGAPGATAFGGAWRRHAGRAPAPPAEALRRNRRRRSGSPGGGNVVLVNLPLWQQGFQMCASRLKILWYALCFIVDGWSVLYC